MTIVERRTRTQDTTGRDELSVKLLPRTEGPFLVRSATDTTVVTEQDGVENSVSIDRVTKMPRRPGDIVAPAPPTESDAEVATQGAEYVVHRIVGHRISRGKVEHKVGWYGYTALEDTYEPADGLLQPFIDRYWCTHQQGRAARPKPRARTRFVALSDDRARRRMAKERSVRNRFRLLRTEPLLGYKGEQGPGRFRA